MINGSDKYIKFNEIKIKFFLMRSPKVMRAGTGNKNIILCGPRSYELWCCISFLINSICTYDIEISISTYDYALRLACHWNELFFDTVIFVLDPSIDTLLKGIVMSSTFWDESFIFTQKLENFFVNIWWQWPRGHFDNS